MNASICCCSLLLYVCLDCVGNKLDTCLDKTLGAGDHPKLALILFKLNQEPGKKKKKKKTRRRRRKNGHDNGLLASTQKPYVLHWAGFPNH
jgi:hypothetical protein